jgi:WD40 repeat protein
VPRLAADGNTVLPIVRPGSAPLVAIAQAISAAGAPALAATPLAISTRIADLVAKAGAKKLVLVIDQFEELITLVRTSAERDEALGLLAQLSTAHADTLRIVVTIRTDFEPNFDRSAFGDRWRDGRYVVPPMSRENLRAVIEKPATARVLYFDPSNLVDTLLDDVVATPGGLPLLSFALSEMYIAYVKRQSGDRAITRADYDALGGVVGALRSRAESEYASLDDAHKGTLRRVMLRLVTTDGGGLARRRVLDDELDFADDGERTRAADVVQRLTAARLLVEGKEPDGEAFVEPAHDALVRGWGRLLEWVREENEAKFPLQQQQKLARAADEWDRGDAGSKSGLLWSDSSRSAQLSPLVRQKAPFLNRREMAFAQRSIRGRRLTMATAAGAVLTIGIAGVAAAIGGMRASQRAEQVRVSAVVRTASSMVTEDPLTATLLLGSLDSATVRDADDATRLAMLNVATQLRALPRVMTTFGTVGDAMSAAEISHDGTRFVTATAGDSVVRLWNTDGRGSPTVLRGAPGNIVAVTISEDNALVAAGGEEGWVRVWRGDGSVPPQSGSTHPKLRVRRLEFSPGARFLLIVYDEGQSELLDLTQPGAPGAVPGDGITTTFGVDASQLLAPTELPYGDIDTRGDSTALTTVTTLPGVSIPRRAPHLFPVDGSILAVAVSPARDRVAIGTTKGTVVIYSLVAKRAPVVLSRAATGNEAVTAVTWSADGATIAATMHAPVAPVWDAQTGELLNELQRPDYAMDRVSFSPGTARVVTTSQEDFGAELWELPGNQRTRLSGHTQQLLTAGFVRDDDHLITASWDGGARLWALPASRIRIPTPPAPPRPMLGFHKVMTAAFSPDSRHLALGTAQGAVWLFTPDSSSDGRLLRHPSVSVQQLAFTTDGAALHAVGYNGERTNWALAGTDSGRTVKQVSRLTVHPQVQQVLAANGSLGGRYLHDEPLFLFDLAGRQPARVLDTGQKGVFCAALSDDGSRVATCGSDSTVVIARTDGSGRIRTVRHSGGARPGAVALDHDGSALAIGYEDGRVRFLTGAPTDTGVILTGHRQRIRQLSFSRGTGRLLSTSDDGTIRIWDLRSSKALTILRPRGLVIGEAAFLPDGRRVITRSVSEPDVRVWNLDGSGTSVAFPVRVGKVGSMAVSPDGRWLFVGDDDQGFELFSLDPDEAIGAFRADGAGCMSPAERVRYLMVSEKDASARSAACEARRAASAAR